MAIVENHKEEVPFAHYEELFRDLNPADAQARLGEVWNGREFILTLLGRTYAISHPVYAIRPLDGGAVPPLPVQTFLLRYLLESKAVRLLLKLTMIVSAVATVLTGLGYLLCSKRQRS